MNSLRERRSTDDQAGCRYRLKSLYKNASYAAIWNFQPPDTGTAIILAAVMTSLVVRYRY